MVKHNGYKLDGQDTLLEGVKEYLDSITKEDKIIIFTSRIKEYEEMTVEFLNSHNIRYDDIVFNMPLGVNVLFFADFPKNKDFLKNLK